MKALLIMMLLMPAFAYTVDISASGSTYVQEDYVISASVTDGVLPVNYPSCNLEIKNNGQTEQLYTMASLKDHAETTAYFVSTGQRTAIVTCYDGEDQKVFDVDPNSKLFIDLNSVSEIGDKLTISADYKDQYDAPISTGYCHANVDPEDGSLSGVNLYYDESTQQFVGYYTIVSSGYHSVDISCSDSYHSDLDKSEGFSIDKVPVTITPSEGLVSGNFGDFRSVSISIAPYTTTCYSDKGNMVKTSSYYYTLTTELDFLGSQDIQVYCSAPGYDSSSKNIRFESSEVQTRVELQFSTDKPYSFQQFSVKPNYYDNNWNPINDADCKLTVENQTKSIKSFQNAYFKAPAGPADSSISVNCSKYGYKTFGGVALFEVKPIEVTLNLEYPEVEKEGNIFTITSKVFPKIQADCDLTGELISPSGITLSEVNDNNYLFGSGDFQVQLNESGEFNFEVFCSAQGYQDVKEKGIVNITIISDSEEIQATIILTTLTAILAIGFMLIRKWI